MHECVCVSCVCCACVCVCVRVCVLCVRAVCVCVCVCVCVGLKDARFFRKLLTARTILQPLFVLWFLNTVCNQ